MKTKKLVAIILTVILAFSVLAGCGGGAGNDDAKDDGKKEEKTPVEMPVDSYFTYSFPVEGIGDFTYYFHFYDEVPGLGNVYYIGYCLNQINFAGVYEVKEEEYSYEVYEKREAEETTSGKAPYTIVFYDFNGTELDRCGFDGEKIYNDMEKLTGTAGTPCVYARDTDGAESKYAETYEAEADMTFAAFLGESDETQSLKLYHNGQYMDLVNSMVEGSWGRKEEKDGSVTFTLTPNSESDTAATLKVSADGATAEYVPADGDTVNMMQDLSANTIAQFKGQMEVMEGVMGDLILDLYADGNCKLIIDVYGNVFDLDKGPYEMKTDDAGATLDITFELAGAVTSHVSAETNDMAVQYVLPGTDLGDINVELLRVSE